MNLKVDYAHESTGFPTWHRQYLLWMEWEIQYMLKPTRPDTYHTFRLPYWDWRREIQKSTVPFTPFTRARLGTVTNNNNLPQVTGDLFDRNEWRTICWFNNINEDNNPAPVCDPSDVNGQRLLQRCPLLQISDRNPCDPDNEDWPTVKDVNDALGKSTYDVRNFDRYTNAGFRNFLEGFVPVTRDECENDRFCDTDKENRSILRKLHNTVSFC